MAGHNKWSKIKRKKGVSDVKKGKVFSKLVRLIELAAQKGGDPQTNYELRAVVEEAKIANMPTANIDRAIKKGSGEGKAGGVLEENWYEAYGPGGVAILIKTITDNKNRTVAEVKHILSKNSSSLADIGSVRWQFNENGAPNFFVDVSEEDSEKLGKLIGELEENNDVQEVFTNNK